MSAAAISGGRRVTLFLLLLLQICVRPTLQHARLMEPPSRASMWRVGFPTPVDEDDNQSYCGGFGVQFGRNGGMCGICGDSWDAPVREHEAPGGLFANGVISKTYRQGSLIPIIVDITANHQGHFEFKVCPNNDIFFDPDQECFDRVRLTTGTGFNEIDYAINDYDTGLRILYVRLPLDLVCEQCILQWTYVAGNNWGDCDDGTSGLGCGPQEHFRSCADIRIVPHPLLKAYNERMGINTTSVGQKYGSFNVGKFAPTATSNVDEQLAIDFSEISEVEADSVTTRDEREELLMKKKVILERVLAKLKELILLNSDKDPRTTGSNQGPQESEARWNSLDDMREEEWNRKPLKPEWNEQGIIAAGDPDDPWWNRIISNAHG